MRRNILTILLITLFCVGFKSVRENREPIIYLLPKAVEKKAIECFKEVSEQNKEDSLGFYVGFRLYHSADTFLLTLHTYHVSSKGTTSKLERLIKATNRYVKIDCFNLPIIYTEDYLFSEIVNTVGANGGISRTTPFGRYYSIVFTGKSHEQGTVIWEGWSGG